MPIRPLVLLIAVALSASTQTVFPKTVSAERPHARRRWGHRSRKRSDRPDPPADLRSVLLDQLHSTHEKAEWFVPVNTAVAGLTVEQAKWIPVNAEGNTDPNANHSVGMLAYHLWFFDFRALAQFKHEPVPRAPDNNDETFNDFNPASWATTVRDLDQVMTALEDFVVHASNAELALWAPTLANISTHNAYHTGQILYVRKLQGSWNPSNGVK